MNRVARRLNVEWKRVKYAYPRWRRRSQTIDAPALLFLHIPKTAGSTLREVLRSRYFARETFETTKVKTTEGIRRLPREQRSQFSLVLGHFAFGLHELMPQPCEYITVLREPVARTISTYHHILRVQIHEHHARFHRDSITLREFAGMQMADNKQTRMLANANHVPCGELTAEHLERAKENLASCAVVGVQQRFDAFLTEVDRRFRLQLGPVADQNVATNYDRKQQLDPATHSALLNASRLDRELFDFACELAP